MDMHQKGRRSCRPLGFEKSIDCLVVGIDYAIVAACCIAAGVISVIRSRKLAAYKASLEEKAA